MRRVSSSEARTHFYELTRWVEQTGRPVVIQRRGKDMAVLRPLEQADRIASEIKASSREE